MDLKNIRTNYKKSNIDFHNLDKDPINFFLKWLEQALESINNEANACLLSTISVDNTHNDFNIEVEILNRQNQNLGTLFTIYVNIFPTIVVMTNEYIVPDILIDLVKIDLLQFYNLNTLYTWDELKDIIRFTSTHNVNHETGELELRGYQSGNQLFTEIGHNIHAFQHLLRGSCQFCLGR